MPQPTKTEIRRLRRDRERLDRLRAEIAELEPKVIDAEDRLLEWIEDQGTGDSVVIHGMQLVVGPSVKAQVDWKKAYREDLGDECANHLIARVESQYTAGITITDAIKEE